VFGCVCVRVRARVCSLAFAVRHANRIFSASYHIVIWCLSGSTILSHIIILSSGACLVPQYFPILSYCHLVPVWFHNIIPYYHTVIWCLSGSTIFSHIIIWCLSGSTIYPILSHKRHVFRNKKLVNKRVYFLYNRYLYHFSFYEELSNIS
jgi:hypothetical protein